jgi:hypothetical protein
MTFLRRRSGAALAGALFTMPLGPGGATSTPPPAPESAYAIYNVVLTHWVDGDPRATVSVVRFTRLGPTECLAEGRRSRQWKSAVADLRRRNASASSIEAKFTLPFQYELADRMERVGGILPPPPGKDPAEFLREDMATLADMGRRHFTQVQLSTPGISADGQLAIVYVSISFSGEFRVLRRAGTTWTVQPAPECHWIAQSLSGQLRPAA